jgi:hypothetical protein
LRMTKLRPCTAQLELEICGLADSLWRTRELGLLHGCGAIGCLILRCLAELTNPTPERQPSGLLGWVRDKAIKHQ